MGSTGDSPVLVGDSPTGMGAWNATRPVSLLTNHTLTPSVRRVAGRDRRVACSTQPDFPDRVLIELPSSWSYANRRPALLVLDGSELLQAHPGHLTAQWSMGTHRRAAAGRFKECRRRSFSVDVPLRQPCLASFRWSPTVLFPPHEAPLDRARRSTRAEQQDRPRAESHAFAFGGRPSAWAAHRQAPKMKMDPET